MLSTLSREKVSDNRRYARAVVSGTARVKVRHGRRHQSFSAKVRNVTPTGVLLEWEDSPSFSANEEVTMFWKVPRALHSEASGVYPLHGRWTRVERSASTNTYFGAVKLDSLMGEQVIDHDLRKRRWLLAALIFVLAGVIALLKSRNVISFWYQPVLQIYSLAAALFVLSRIGISMFYRQPRDNGYMPSISVIIAAKNEEARMGECIEKCFSARYPKSLIEVIAVDDGSTDGTWDVLNDKQRQFPQLRAFRFEQNRGKRHGMALGAREAKGEILIFIDSDSNVEPEGFYRIVQPFADARVGAVAGHTLVIVEPDNFISKMEAVRYFVSQRVMKAAESVFHAVTCCPGPFSAYRRDAMMAVIDPWENQRFLGTQSTFGDDRSLTNFILRNYRVLYHSGARCATYAPDRWSVFFKQQLRWKKSWFRETTVAARFMWRKHPAAAIAYYASVLITVFSPLIAVRALFYLPVVFGTISFLPYIAGLFLVYTLFGLIHDYHTKTSRWYYGPAFAVLYICVLSLQNYYALATVHKNHWGTR
jgi:hyaluronan synthase